MKLYSSAGESLSCATTTSMIIHGVHPHIKTLSTNINCTISTSVIHHFVLLNSL